MLPIVIATRKRLSTL